MSISVEDLKKELNRENGKKRKWIDFVDTVKFATVFMAVLIILSTVMFPIFRVSGDSMHPTLQEGEFCVFLKTSDCEVGDIVTFYNNGDTLIKRVIADGGDVVNITSDGTLYVNGEVVEEDYIASKSQGYCTVSMPLVVPDGELFVMGDNRELSLDSRSTEVGCISYDRVIGKKLFSIPYISI